MYRFTNWSLNISVICPPTFAKVPENVELLEHEKVEFKVEARGKPVPDILWSLQDKPLVKDDRLTIESSSSDKTYKTKSSLSIDKVEMEDTNNVYQIEARNKLGSVKHTVALLGKLLAELKCDKNIKIFGKKSTGI